MNRKLSVPSGGVKVVLGPHIATSESSFTFSAQLASGTRKKYERGFEI
ncbi:hypothetical protein M9C83_06800 [SAR86 cluster bacterium]|nr:hypothetical protein M9C83_06800 [SAR86 cluster bacterium]